MESKNSDGGIRKSVPQKLRKQIIVKLICKGCCKYIEKTINAVDGAELTNCDNKTGLVTISFSPLKTSLDKIEWAIAASGFDTPKHKRKIEFYTDMPKCCKHREDSFSGENSIPRA